MDALTARLRREHPNIYPPNGGLTFSIVPLQEQVVGDVRRSLLVLTASVAFVLLIACANVANLLLSRALARERRGGAARRDGRGPRRESRVQFLTESVLLALLGGGLGLLLTAAMLAGHPRARQRERAAPGRDRARTRASCCSRSSCRSCRRSSSGSCRRCV